MIMLSSTREYFDQLMNSIGSILRHVIEGIILTNDYILYIAVADYFFALKML